MMTQSVMTQAAAMLANTSGSVTLKGRQTANDFSMYFGNSLKSAQNNTGKANSATVQKNTTAAGNTGNSNTSDTSTTDDVQAKAISNDNAAKTVTEQGSDQKVPVTQTDDSKTDGTVTVNTDQSEEPVVDEQLIAQLQAMLQTIGQAVMDQLKLSPEEFNQLLTKQGMSLTDLLQPQNLQQLVIAGSGATDVLSALTDEKLAGTMKQLIQTVGDIIKDNSPGLSADQIKQLMEQAAAQQQDQAKPVEVGVKSEVEVQSSMPQEVQDKTEKNSKSTEHVADKASDRAIDEAGTKTDNRMTETAKADTPSHSDSNSSQDKQYAADRFQTFVDNLVKAAQNPEAQFNTELNQTTSLRDIANQIVDRIKVSVTPETKSMELQLNPESLGKVNLTVESKSGVLSAHFVVQSEVSKEAIESQIQTLRETLHQQGVKVEAIEVTVSANAFEQNSSNNPGNDADTKENGSGRKISLEDALSMTDADNEAERLENVTDTSGSVINYTA